MLNYIKYQKGKDDFELLTSEEIEKLDEKKKDEIEKKLNIILE